jgi:hypothetical protein
VEVLAYRDCGNETELTDELARRGFTILDVVEDSLERIFSHLVPAKLVISVEGSHVAHCCPSLRTGSGLMLLQPPDRFIGSHRGWSESLGIQFGFVVGEKKGRATYFDMGDILKTNRPFAEA